MCMGASALPAPLGEFTEGAKAMLPGGASDGDPPVVLITLARPGKPCPECSSGDTIEAGTFTRCKHCGHRFDLR